MEYTSIDEMNNDYSDPEIQARLERGYQQVLRREGTPIDKVREEFTKDIDYSDPEIQARLERGYQQAMRGEGRPKDEVFDDLEKAIQIASEDH